MLLFLLSSLVIGSGNCQNIGYPYRVLYDLARYPPKAESLQGLLIFIDNTGTERIVSYNYAEPVYAIRRITFIKSENNESRNLEPPALEYDKAREAHFKAWSLQQYQVLKREIDFIRSEGKEPSNPILLKYLPLEKIALTADFSTIAEFPEIKRIQEEHFNVWKHAIHTDEKKIMSNFQISNVDLKSSIMKLKDFEIKQQYAQGDTSENGISLHPFFNKTLNDKIKANNTGSESRSSNETKNLTNFLLESKKYIETKKPFTTAEDATGQINLKINNSIAKDIKIMEPPTNSISKNIKPDICTNSGQSLTCLSNKNNKEQPLDVKHTDEVFKANQDHLKIIVKATKPKVHSEVEKLIFHAPGVYVPQQVVDTDAVKRAREEHLKIVNQAIDKIKLAQALEHRHESSKVVRKESD